MYSEYSEHSNVFSCRFYDKLTSCPDKQLRERQCFENKHSVFYRRFTHYVGPHKDWDQN